jgi:N-ethylmaleimide reductase
MKKLFDNLKIGRIELKNRIVMAPMTRSRADDEGVQTEIVTEYYRQRASAGLIITEATNVSPMAKGYVRTPGIYTAEQIESWRKITDTVHAANGKIFMQLFHTGRIALPDFLPDNAQPVAPSAVKADGKNKTDSGMKDFVEPREMTVAEIKQTVEDFAAAAKNAVAAGFDGVELHGANGYLVHQFLGTNTNLRTDEYGGSFENRARFLFEVVDAISDAIGSERLGWVDRVFASGRIYGREKIYENGLGQSQKRAMVIMTTGGGYDSYGGYGVNPPLDTILAPIQHGVF